MKNILINEIKENYLASSYNNLIFLVDDSPIFTELVENFLSDFPDTLFLKFKTGEECLKKMHLKPDIVVLDYEFDLEENHLNGIEVLKNIKKINSNVEVIMLSGHNNTNFASTAIKLGAFDYVIKD